MHGVDYVLHAILDYNVDGYLPIVDAIEDSVLAMGTALARLVSGPDEITRIFTLRRQLAKFQRVLGPMAEVAGKLVRLDLPCIDPEAGPISATCWTMCGASRPSWTSESRS